MSISSDQRNPVELLAEEFLARKRRGEEPTLREYLERHPDLAGEIRELFPALLMMEDLGDSSGATTGSLAAEDGIVSGARLERLGDYRILREIGRGGMGVVYQAEQESLGRRVALKVLSAGSLLDPKQVRRFDREAKAAARLHHTNIVPVFGVGHQDGHHYFVMQFISGLGLDLVLEDLRQLRRAKVSSSRVEAIAPQAQAQGEPSLRPVAPCQSGLTAAGVARSLLTGGFASAGPIPLGETVTDPIDPVARTGPPPIAPAGRPAARPSSAALHGSSEVSALSDSDRSFYQSVARIGVQVAEALEYANRQGILHRDIKPSNLLLDNRGNVWVADFGLAKTTEADDLTHSGDILGTIRYMAPERFSGHCDARSDVYSLGLTLYELVALRPAYESSDRHTLIEQVLHEEPERLKKHAPGVPRDLETIITKASARDPAGRYATAAALAEDLKRIVEDRPIRARRISLVERFARWQRRNKLLAASMGVAAVALCAVALVSGLYAVDRTRYAARLADEASRTKAALRATNAQYANLALERGRNACEQGEVGRGLLWMVESLRSATRCDDAALEHAARVNLASWSGQLAALRAILSHQAGINCVAFSPDGKAILSGSYDRTLRLWDPKTGRQRGRSIEHRGSVMAAAFGPGGNTILTGCSDGTARLWDTATGEPIGAPMVHRLAVVSVAFSRDGKALLTGGDDMTARLWDAATGQPRGEPLVHGAVVRAVAFSPDGRTIATGGWDMKARLWDVVTGQPRGDPLEHRGVVYAVAFSPDGSKILTGSLDKTAVLWDAATGRPLGAPMEHQSTVRAVAFSPDGRIILTGCYDKTARLWDAATGRPLGTPMEHQSTVRAVAFASDSKAVLTGSWDAAARLWEIPRAQGREASFEHPGQVNAVAFGRDGKFLLTGGNDKSARLWDTATGEPIGRPMIHQDSVTSVAFSPDGKSILTGCSDKIARLWDVATGEPIGRPMVHQDSVTSVAFSPDGRTILTGCLDKTARLWDAATGQLRAKPLEHEDIVHAVAFSPDGKRALTGSRDSTARLWDANTGEPIGRPLVHHGPVRSLAFSPDGKSILTGCWDTSARLWEAATGRPLGKPLEHEGTVDAVAFSPDGKTILTGSLNGTAQFWDVATARPVGKPLVHQGQIRSMAFSPDGKTALTGSIDHHARLWPVPSPVAGDINRIQLWTQVLTGLELDPQANYRVLDAAIWQERRERLKELGGPPGS
jgi:WD40 repeat protein/serine/threonine protein kinase